MEASSGPVIPHLSLSAFVGDDAVVIQPAGVSGSSPVETLSIDLRSGSVQQLQSAPQRIKPIPIHAVLGVVRLFKGSNGAHCWHP